MNTITDCTGYWDGPLSGACIYEGVAYNFFTYIAGGWVGDPEGDVACCVPRLYTLHDTETGEKVGAAFDYEFVESWRAPK